MAFSTQLITDLKNAYATGPSALSAANSTAPAGVIQDIPGNIHAAMVALTDAKRTLTEVLKDIDTTGPDPILATLQNVYNTLV